MCAFAYTSFSNNIPFEPLQTFFLFHPSYDIRKRLLGRRKIFAYERQLFDKADRQNSRFLSVEISLSSINSNRS